MSEDSEAKKRRYWRRRAAGQCVRCGVDAGGASLCATHWQMTLKPEPVKPEPVKPEPVKPQIATLVPVRSSWQITPRRRGPWGEARVARL